MLFVSVSLIEMVFIPGNFLRNASSRNEMASPLTS
jgi:hypothetical protein